MATNGAQRPNAAATWPAAPRIHPGKRPRRITRIAKSPSRFRSRREISGNLRTTSPGRPRKTAAIAPAAYAIPIAIPAAATLAQLGFRLLYYGDWVPNSAHAKVGITVEHLFSGAVYLVSGYGSLVALAAPALVVGVLALRDPGASRRVRLLLAPLVVWSAYVAVIGGDIFPGWRHHVPIAVMLSLLLAEGLLSVAKRGRAAVAVANRLPEPANVQVDLDLAALGLANKRIIARDERSEKTLALKNGRFTAPVQGRNYTFVSLRTR